MSENKDWDNENKIDELENLVIKAKRVSTNGSPADFEYLTTVEQDVATLRAYIAQESYKIVGADEYPNSIAGQNELRATQRKAIADRWGEKHEDS